MIQQNPLQPRSHPLRIQRLRAHRRVRVQRPHDRRRSENYRFAGAGIPPHTLSSFNLHADYHRPQDEARLADGDHLTAVIEATTRAVHLLSLEWKPGGRP